LDGGRRTADVDGGRPTRTAEGEQRAADSGQRRDAYASRVVINGAHAIIFSQDAEATRAFLRDTLGLPSVDAGHGWLIFGLPPAEVAAHPTEGAPHHELYLMCDDLHATIELLKARGVEFTRDVAEERWGLTTAFRLPGGGELALYEPRHARPPQLDVDPKPER
jgi:catechol 2,3-dioxygenase-like lactoylglutathione lyase family enzyme